MKNACKKLKFQILKKFLNSDNPEKPYKGFERFSINYLVLFDYYRINCIC